MDPTSVKYAAYSARSRILRNQIFSAAESFFDGTLATSHQSSVLYQHILTSDSDPLRTLFEQLPSCSLYIGPGNLFSWSYSLLEALLSVYFGNRDPNDPPKFRSPAQEGFWIASQLVCPSRDPVSEYVELANEVSKNPASLEVLLTISFVRLLFPVYGFAFDDRFFRFRSRDNRYTLNSVGCDSAERSFLETVRPFLSLPFPGTGPLYGRARAWKIGRAHV
jgi:hypothetical protein